MRGTLLARTFTVAAALGLPALAAAAQAPAPAAPAPAADKPAAGSMEDFEGYDFGQVVEAMEHSVHPLQQEMDKSFQVFVKSVEEAEHLLDEGKAHEAAQKAVSAVDGVLAVRDKVLAPMWEGQLMLAEQIAQVRNRLATAVEAAAEEGAAPLDQATETTLDGLARRLSEEQDPLRKTRLMAHYRTVRNLARIRALASQLSPDQRKMWMSVLQVLDEAALAHQQVMMGSEVLFAQFEATAANLRSYLSLMDTVKGASRLIQVVRGVDDHSAGMASFAESMTELQGRLSAFNGSVEQALQGMMLELEAELDAVSPLDPAFGGSDAWSAEDDGELEARLSRLQGEQAADQEGTEP